jgi:hypothetical protein
MENFRNRFAPSASWLFALFALVLAFATAYATKNMPPKISAAIYAAIVGAAGFAAGFTTKARVRSNVLVFVVMGVVVAIGYYWLVSHIFSAAINTVTDATVAAGGNVAAKANGEQAAGVMGKFFGIFAAIIGFLETTIIGIGGAIAGNKFRDQSSTEMKHAHAR